jgi:hypothetical protein
MAKQHDPWSDMRRAPLPPHLRRGEQEVGDEQPRGRVHVRRRAVDEPHERCDAHSRQALVRAVHESKQQVQQLGQQHVRFLVELQRRRKRTQQVGLEPAVAA